MGGQLVWSSGDFNILSFREEDAFICGGAIASFVRDFGG
jgi:hypothetical protein